MRSVFLSAMSNDFEQDFLIVHVDNNTREQTDRHTPDEEEHHEKQTLRIRQALFRTARRVRADLI